MVDGAELAERLLARPHNRYAPWLDREPHRDVVAAGLPGARSEPWKYTNPRRFYETALAGLDAGQDESGALRVAGIEASPAVDVFDFADPRAAALVSAHGGQTFDLRAQPLAAVSGLLLVAGVVVRVRRSEGGGESDGAAVRVGELGAAYQHLLVVVEQDAALELIEEPARFTHRIVEVAVSNGARLRHWRRQGGSALRQCSLLAARLGAGASYALAQSALGAQLRRNDIVATLAGEGAELAISGAWRLDPGCHIDNQVSVRHELPGGFSRQTYRGVVAARARAILNGGIHIAPGARGTDASLSVKNLLADATAEVYAKPELTIYEGDVKCSHGAAVGTLDEDAIFYLRSRGVAEGRARSLLTQSFLKEAIEDLEGARRMGLVA
jgi:Fe-S cluster assembly protein SufD